MSKTPFFALLVTIVFSLIMPKQASCLDVKKKPVFEPNLPVNISETEQQKWNDQDPGLKGSVVSLDKRVDRNCVPVTKADLVWNGTAWRGEKVNIQAALWSVDSLKQVRFVTHDLLSESGDAIDKTNISPYFQRFVIADSTQNKCAVNEPSTSLVLMPDVLEPRERFELPAQTVRPVWITLYVPEETKNGVYRGKFDIVAQGGQKVSLMLNLTVYNLLLPKPSDWTFHLDLWQDPWSVAAHHQVEPWSPEHWSLLEKQTRLLADAGQKCITTSILHEPWGGQVYHTYYSMIKWTKDQDQNWEYDYTVFDNYVRFCEKLGIQEQINCYSMVPWSNTFRYFEKESNDYVDVKAVAGSDEWKALWQPFLTDFRQHLKQNGWLEKTSIAMDERPLDAMQAVIQFVKSIAPELKITLAGNYHSEIKFDIYDYCVFIKPVIESEIILERVNRGLPTTYYICCGPEHPNTFSFSDPVESAWLGWYSAAHGFNGLLRWAFNSWNENPFYDSRYVTWPSGDCYLSYPGGRSSIRFERLREGIQDYEKIQILQKELKQKKDKTSKTQLAKLNDVLSLFKYIEENGSEYYQHTVNDGKSVLNEISAYLGKK